MSRNTSARAKQRQRSSYRSEIWAHHSYLLAGVPAAGNDGNAARLEELHFGDGWEREIRDGSVRIGDVRLLDVEVINLNLLENCVFVCA